MLYEYAVEPQGIGSDWQTFRYVIEKFGFDKGRLISQFPKGWFREVYDACKDLPAGEKKNIEVALIQAKKNKVIRCARPYDPTAGDWLDNAIAEHGRSPFRAIIAGENPSGAAIVLPVNEMNDQQPLMIAPVDFAVARNAPALADAMKEMLRFSDNILFVDPFFDPFNKRYRSTLGECLRIVSEANSGATCEVHYRFHEKAPNTKEIEAEAQNLFVGVIPDGMQLSVFCWKERNGGADFHARYLLTERGGIGIDAGFSAEGEHQTTDMHLMAYAFSQERLKLFKRDAKAYEIVEPVLRISSDGKVAHI